MPEPLQLSMQYENENPMVYIVATILHLRGIEPNYQEIAEVLGGEQFIAGEAVVYLLSKGLSIYTISMFNPQAFLARGHLHWREISQRSWSPEEIATDNAMWKPEKLEYWREKVSRWIEAYRVAGERKQQEIRYPGASDIVTAVRSGGMVIVVQQPNRFTQNENAVLIYGQYGDEYGHLLTYCPEWGEDCQRLQPRLKLQHLCKWEDAGIVIVR